MHTLDELFEIQLNLLKDVISEDPQETHENCCNLIESLFQSYEQFSSLSPQQKQIVEEEYQQKLIQHIALNLAVNINKTWDA